MALRPTALGALLPRDGGDQKDAGQELIDLLKNPFVADKVELLQAELHMLLIANHLIR